MQFLANHIYPIFYLDGAIIEDMIALKPPIVDLPDRDII